MNDPLDSLLTVKQVAKRLHMKPATVQKHCCSGRLKASKIGRHWLVAQADLAAFIQSRKK